MRVLFVILIIILLLVLLWPLTLRCRRGHPVCGELRRWRFAHRGLHDLEQGIPENSLPAFRRAVQQGYGAELDIHLTRDGRLAVMHDDSLLRICGVDRRISQSTAAELADCRLSGTEERIPFFEEVLAVFNGKAPLIVELKVDGSNAAALCTAAMELLDRYEGTFCVESFDPRAVWWMKRHRPEICRGQLCEDYRKPLHGPVRYAVWLFCTSLLTNFLTVPDFIAFRFSDRHCLSLRLIRRLHDAAVVHWTLQSLEELAACEAEGAIPIFEHCLPGGLSASEGQA